MRIAFVGTHPPRLCGIATFTRDLAAGVASAGDDVSTMALALTDPGETYDYPAEVELQIRQEVKADYVRAAELLNHSGAHLVSIQHEHGIFGGESGDFILDLVAGLRVPVMATLHTVLKDPSDSQRRVVAALSRRCARLVVMSRVAADLLQRSYGIPAANVKVIPHGIPVMAPRDQRALKAALGVPGQPMLLTFGLLGPSKGIETVLRALPALVAEFPDIVYFVVGATHPAVARKHGEAYRATLDREAERLGVRRNVVFRDQFVSTDELCGYLQAADIFITPYQNEAQVTSGALSYAMGAGAAAVSTPYWHAQELLADGRGRLFPFGDSAALAGVVKSLLRSPQELSRVRAAAHELTRSLVWPRIGAAHLELARAIVSEAPTPARRPGAPLAGGLPDLRLDHLVRLTDDTGILQHASYSVPSRRDGYCVDDNARALIVALAADRLGPSPDTRRLVTTYLGYLHFSQDEVGGFANLMSYGRALRPGSQSDDCVGRALWALGTGFRLAADEGHRCLAGAMFERALQQAAHLGPRGTATAVLGLTSFLSRASGAGAARTMLDGLVQKLVRWYEAEATMDWRWFEPSLTYDNALIPMALFTSFPLLEGKRALRIARESLGFLEQVCFEDDGQLRLVGNSGWQRRGGRKPAFDEQAVDAAAFVMAFRSAYQVTQDRHYLRRMHDSFAWFLGANRLGLPLYDFVTGGCRDGLGDTQPNHNQGAESTISFLLSLLEMLDVGPDELPARGN